MPELTSVYWYLAQLHYSEIFKFDFEISIAFLVF